MNMQSEKEARSLAEAGGVDATLRLIAGLPAPAGLEDRVKTALQREPAGRSAKLLDWPAGSWVHSAWVRGAAAAAIVVVVAGGSWGVYTRVQPKQAPIAIPHVVGAGGFSSANAMRTPKTLDAPTVTLRANPESATVKKQTSAKKKASQNAKSGTAQAAAARSNSK